MKKASTCSALLVMKRGRSMAITPGAGGGAPGKVAGLVGEVAGRLLENASFLRPP